MSHAKQGGDSRWLKEFPFEAKEARSILSKGVG